MRKRHPLLVSVAAAAVCAVPAAPAHALPYCGGTWVYGADCTFEAPGGAFAIGGSATEGDQGVGSSARIIVRVYVEVAGLQYVLGSCKAEGVAPVACTTVVSTYFEGYPHHCEVDGVRGGTYFCVDPPRLPAQL